MTDRYKVLDQFANESGYVKQRIKNGIEENRKGFAEINLKNADGTPAVGAKIKFTQKDHEFKYGANLFMLDELETEEKNRKYKEYFKDTFNLATLPFYWDTLEPEQGKPRFSKDSKKVYRRPAPDLCLEFCEKNGIEPKAHCLNYDHFAPDWIKNATVPQTKQALSKRFRELAERYSGRIPRWEVTNELFWPTASTPFYWEPDFVDWSYKTADKYFPDNSLVINEGQNNVWISSLTNRNTYYMIIERALAHGAKIDEIGIQYHMFSMREQEAEQSKPYFDPERLLAVMDLLGKFGLPMHITELTVPAYSDSSDDEEIQAQLIKNLYEIWFSHKSMNAIIYWNLVDGYAFGAKPGDMKFGENYYYGGLLNFNLEPKPAFKVINDLFKNKWISNGITETGENGNAEFKGFYGKYDLEIVCGGKTVKKEINLSGRGVKSFDITL